LWSIGEIAAYSLIPYKTPWLMLNMTAPLALAAGYACGWVWERRAAKSRVALAGAALAVAALMTYQAIVLNFVEYDNDKHPYVYAHTSREVLAMVREINRIEEANPRSSIAITSPDHFPLSWYLRDYPAGYYGRAVVTKDPLVIASVDQQPTLDAALGDGFERVGVYSLRPGVQLVLYASRGLRREDAGTAPSLPRLP
jgi:predicted membrane-bound mannosyltransferase